MYGESVKGFEPTGVGCETQWVEQTPSQPDTSGWVP